MYAVAAGGVSVYAVAGVREAPDTVPTVRVALHAVIGIRDAANANAARAAGSKDSGPAGPAVAGLHGEPASVVGGRRDAVVVDALGPDAGTSAGSAVALADDAVVVGGRGHAADAGAVGGGEEARDRARSHRRTPERRARAGLGDQQGRTGRGRGEGCLGRPRGVGRAHYERTTGCRGRGIG